MNEVFVIGEPFPYLKMFDGVFLNFIDGKFNLLIGLKNISDGEIEAFNHNEINFNLAFIDNIIFLLFEIDELFYLSSTPLHIGLLPNESKQDLDNKNFPINMFFIDTRDNDLKAIRNIPMQKDFSDTFIGMFKTQLEKPFNREEYDKNLERIYETITDEEIKNLSLASFKDVKITG